MSWAWQSRKTWDEFVTVLDTLKENDLIPISTPAKDNWMIPIVMDAIGAPRYGGQQFEQDILAGKTDFTDPDYVAAIELMNWLLPYLPEDVVGVSYEDSRALFLNELAGIFLGGSFEVGYWRDNGPDLDLGVFEVPSAAPTRSPRPAWSAGMTAPSASTPTRIIPMRRSPSSSGWVPRSSASSTPRR